MGNSPLSNLCIPSYGIDDRYRRFSDANWEEKIQTKRTFTNIFEKCQQSVNKFVSACQEITSNFFKKEQVEDDITLNSLDSIVVEDGRTTSQNDETLYIFDPKVFECITIAQSNTINTPNNFQISNSFGLIKRSSDEPITDDEEDCTECSVDSMNQSFAWSEDGDESDVLTLDGDDDSYSESSEVLSVYSLSAWNVEEISCRIDSRICVSDFLCPCGHCPWYTVIEEHLAASRYPMSTQTKKSVCRIVQAYTTYNETTGFHAGMLSVAEECLVSHCGDENAAFRSFAAIEDALQTKAYRNKLTTKSK